MPDGSTAGAKRAHGRVLNDFLIDGCLLPAENQLREAARVGVECKLGQSRPEPHDDGLDAITVRADFIRFLALGGDSNAPVHEKGVQLRGAYVVGDIDLHGCTVVCPFNLRNSWIEGELSLFGASTRTIDLSGSRIGGVLARSVKVAGSIFLKRGFTAHGKVDFIDADIAGSFECHGARFSNDTGEALYFSRAKIVGSVFLSNGFTAQGEVRFQGATIGGNLKCDGGVFDNPKGSALFGEGVKIGGRVFLNERFRARGEVRFVLANVNGDLSCDGAIVGREGGMALNCSGAKVSGSVYLGRDAHKPGEEAFKAEGEVSFVDAEIGGSLECQGGAFCNHSGPDAVSLHFSRAEIAGSVFLEAGFRAEGEVRFSNASVGGNFACRGGVFNTPGGVAIFGEGATIVGSVLFSDAEREHLGAIRANGLVTFKDADIEGSFICSRAHFVGNGGRALNGHRCNVKGSIFLNHGCVAKGQVSFADAVVGGSVDCSSGHFDASGEKASDALAFNRADIVGNVFLTGGFQARGGVRFRAATISGSLDCRGARFVNVRPVEPEGDRCADALDLRDAHVGGAVRLGSGAPEDRRVVIEGSLDLRNLKTPEFIDHRASWPPEHVHTETGERLSCYIHLNGFTYDRFGDGSTLEPRWRKRWLRRQPVDDLGRHFKPQPFEHLMRVLRDMGHDEDARIIAIYKERHHVRRPLREGFWKGWRWWLSPFKLLHWLLYGLLVGYGYRSHRVVFLAIGVWLACGLIYWSNSEAFVPKNLNREQWDCACQKAAGEPVTPNCANTKPEARCKEFWPFAYSFDVLLPVVDLHFESEWEYEPVGKKSAVNVSLFGKPFSITTDAVQIAGALEILLGWLGGLVFVALLSRKMDRE